MSQVDLAELRRLHEAATKGEWYASPDGFIDVPVSRTKAKQVCRAEKQKDAEFIAAAHNALPALLDEFETALEEVRRLTQANGDLRAERDRAVKEAQRQGGVAKRLRQEAKDGK